MCPSKDLGSPRSNVIRTDELVRYRDYLRLLAETELPARLHHKIDPADIVQATLLKACESIDSLKARTEKEIAAWLRTILARSLLNTLRDLHRGKRDIRRERSLEEALSRSSARLESLARTEDSSPSRKAEHAETVLELSKALTRLPDSQRQALVLQHWRGWSLDQIARHMGRTRNAVAGLLRRGVTRLREELKDLE